MLEIQQFDIKSGQSIPERLNNGQISTKKIDNSYLEHWCQVRGIDPADRFFTAQFHAGVNDFDRQRLEADGKYLVFSNGKSAYFTDFETAQAISLGNGVASPIYSGERNDSGDSDAAHNAVAYGGLIPSDGVASTALPTARILVIEVNENGPTKRNPQIVGSNGNPLSEKKIQQLYDKLGDGTVLASSTIMRSLLTSTEKEEIAARAAKRTGLEDDFSSLAQELTKAATSNDLADKQEEALAKRSVYQFRAGIPELPGMMKGTISSSEFCGRFIDVDLIITTDAIKGDDGRLSKLGIQAVKDLFVSRKETAQYGQQSKGPQVNLTIPTAAEIEIVPIVEQKVAKLAQCTDFTTLKQHYIEQKGKEQQRPFFIPGDDGSSSHRVDPLYEVLSADTFGLLNNHPKIVEGLERYRQGEWRRLATNGTSAPSAMAQPHQQLKPWEICNKDIVHGAIVAYYRSPFPNVGAAVVAINNHNAIKTTDPEAFCKTGVSYLSPWVAKHVGNTDYDGDTNAYIIGTEANVSNLPTQIRDELAWTQNLDQQKQYDAALGHFIHLFDQLEQGQETRLSSANGGYFTVQEFAERNQPAVRPPRITKQKKIKHPWREGESLSTATWRAATKAANNPTAEVASTNMVLQAMALECRYVPSAQKEALVKQISQHFENLLKQNEAGKISIPSDDYLKSQSFSYSLITAMKEVTKISISSLLDANEDADIKEQVTEKSLAIAAKCYQTAAEVLGAKQLQIAVDTPKSAHGIDKEIVSFLKALPYKEDELRKNRKSAEVYSNGKVMPINMATPIHKCAQVVNEQYLEAQLERRQYFNYYNVFPTPGKDFTNRAKGFVQKYNQVAKEAAANQARFRRGRAEDLQPTLVVISQQGRQIVLQNIKEFDSPLPIWRAEGKQPNWTITIRENPNARSERSRFPAKLTFVDKAGNSQTLPVGYVSPKSAANVNLEAFLAEGSKAISLSQPTVSLQLPWAQQYDSDRFYQEIEAYAQPLLAPKTDDKEEPRFRDFSAERQKAIAAVWQQASHIVLRHASKLVSERVHSPTPIPIGQLQVSPEIKQLLTAQKVHTIQFGRDLFPRKDSQVLLSSVHLLQPKGERLLLGSINERHLTPPDSAVFMAELTNDKTSDRIIRMQVMELPTVEQSPAQMSAMKEGRRHLTSYDEPFKLYGVKAGDVVVARSENGGEQIALRIGSQHQITQAIASKPGASEHWADAEQASADRLMRYMENSKDQSVWGMNFQVLGTYNSGQIQPIKAVKQLQRLRWASTISNAVQTVYGRLAKEQNQAEVNDYLITQTSTELVLTRKSDGDVLARFAAESGQVVAADGIEQTDFNRWKAAMDSGKNSAATIQHSKSLER